MKRTLHQLRKYFIRLVIMGALASSSCGGGEDAASAAPPPQCHGAATITCAELNAEFCVHVGCELRRESEASGLRCVGETPPVCVAASYESECAQVSGCEWSE